MNRAHPALVPSASAAASLAAFVLLAVSSPPGAHAQGLLSELGAPSARERLADANSRVRQAALETILRTADRAACPWLLRRALREEPTNALAPDLLRGLGRLRCRAAAPQLWRVVRSSIHPALVRAAIDALGRLGDPRSIPRLADLARTGQAVRPAVRAIARFGQAGARALRRLADRSPIARAAALRVLVAWRLPGHAQALRKALHRRTLSPAEALQVLSEAEDLSFGDAVVPYLFHPDRAVQSRALSVLARVGTRDQASAVMTRLADDALRSLALQTLVQIAPRRSHAHQGTPRARPWIPPPTTPLLSLVRVGHGQVPLLATTALGRLTGRAAIPPLAWMAEHAPPRLRAQAVRALQYVRTPAAARVLRRILRRGGTLAPLAAVALGSLLRAPARALDRWHPVPRSLRSSRRAAIADLMALLRGRDIALRVAAVKGLGRIRALAARGDLLRLLRIQQAPAPRARWTRASASPRARGGAAPVMLRRAAAEALAHFRSDATAQALTLALQNDPDPGVRAVAALSLASLGSSWPLDALARALRDAPEPVVMNAAYALGRLGYRDAAPALTPLLRSRSRALRANAALALGRLRYTAARGRLVRLARADPSPHVRRAAATALAWAMGKKAPALLRRLLRREMNPVVAGALARAVQDTSPGRPSFRPPAASGWIDFRLEGAKGRPLPSRAFRLRLPTGDCLMGATDLLGMGGAELIPEGEVDVALLSPPSGARASAPGTNPR